MRDIVYIKSPPQFTIKSKRVYIIDVWGCAIAQPHQALLSYGFSRSSQRVGFQKMEPLFHIA